MKKVILHIENIKSYTQKIKESSPDNLKHTQLLQQISKSLGFNNYQTLKGIADKNRGYLEIPVKYHSSPIIAKKIAILDKMKNDMEMHLKNSIKEPQKIDYFYEKGLSLLSITNEALKSFIFLDFDIIHLKDRLNTLMSFDNIMYYYYLSIIAKNEELIEQIEYLFGYGTEKNEQLQIVKKEFTKSIHYISDLDEFINKNKSFITNLTSLIQTHAYAQQIWVSTLSIINREEEIYRRMQNYQEIGDDALLDFDKAMEERLVFKKS
ncbi:hypothetical protein [Aliarcobacter butzleri]|uniref:hypothetical protein n=1 Tax=Aliarcobacter butzleri TaxID=28197 RepID=UPI001269F9D2|nr:hypothetical protein [Aliarcobacter butzleri]